jgi:hypothetical protein
MSAIEPLVADYLLRRGFRPSDVNATGDAAIENGIQTLALNVPTSVRPVDAHPKDNHPITKNNSDEQRLWWEEVLDEEIATHPLLLLHTRARALVKVRENVDELRRNVIQIDDERKIYMKKVYALDYTRSANEHSGSDSSGNSSLQSDVSDQKTAAKNEGLKLEETKMEKKTGDKDDNDDGDADMSDIEKEKKKTSTTAIETDLSVIKKTEPFPSKGVTTWAQVCDDRYSARMSRAVLDVDSSDNTGSDAPHVYCTSVHGWRVHAIAWMTYPQRDSFTSTMHVIPESPTSVATFRELTRSIELLCAKPLSPEEAEHMWSSPATYNVLFDAFDTSIRPPEDGALYQYWQGAALGIMAYRVEETPSSSSSSPSASYPSHSLSVSSSSSTTSFSSAVATSPLQTSLLAPLSSLASTSSSLESATLTSLEPKTPATSSHISKIVVARTRHIDLQLLRRKVFTHGGEHLAPAEWTNWKMLQAPKYCKSFSEDHGDRGQATLLGNRHDTYCYSEPRGANFIKVEVEVSKRSSGLESGDFMVMCTRPVQQDCRPSANSSNEGGGGGDGGTLLSNPDLRYLYDEWWTSQTNMRASHIGVGLASVLTPIDAHVVQSNAKAPSTEFLAGGHLVDVKLEWEPRLVAELVDDPRIVRMLRRYYGATIGVANRTDTRGGVHTKVDLERVMCDYIWSARTEILRKSIAMTSSIADKDRDIQRLTEYIRAAQADGFSVPQNNMPLVLPLRSPFVPTPLSPLLATPVSQSSQSSSDSPSLSSSASI